MFSMHFYLKAADKGNRYVINAIEELYENGYTINQTYFSNIRDYFPFFNP